MSDARSDAVRGMMDFFVALVLQALTKIGIGLNICWDYIVNRNILFLGLTLCVILWAGAGIHRYLILKSSGANVFNEEESSRTEELRRDVKVLTFLCPACPICWHNYVNLARCKRHALSLAEEQERNRFGAPHTISESVLWSLDRMFGYSAARKSICDGSKMEGVAAALLFVLTWLFGSGGLIGAAVAVAQKVSSGTWRCWRLLLQGHTVILGWNDNVPTILLEHMASRRVLLPLIGRRSIPERIVIVTDHDVDEVNRRMKLLLHGRLFVTGSVRHGIYDDNSEIKWLNLRHAHSVIILGESNDPSHDAHVLLTPMRLSEIVSRHSGMRRSSCPVDIHLNSYRLFCQVERMNVVPAGVISKPHENRRQAVGADVLGRPQKVAVRARLARGASPTLRGFEITSAENASNFFVVTHHNFYDSWAKRLFANFYLYSNPNVSDSNRVCLRADKKGDVHLVIVGFDEMGQALATQAARVAHYGGVAEDQDVQTYITVFDDSILFREREYRSLYPYIDEIPDIHLSFSQNVSVGSDAFIRLMKAYARRKEHLTIAIALEDAATGMALAISIREEINRIGDAPKVQVLVRQDIHDRVTAKDEETPVLQVGGGLINVFGMRDGAGYNAWFRNLVAQHWQRCNPNSNLSLVECDELLDAVEEMWRTTQHMSYRSRTRDGCMVKMPNIAALRHRAEAADCLSLGKERTFARRGENEYVDIWEQLEKTLTSMGINLPDVTRSHDKFVSPPPALRTGM